MNSQRVLESIPQEDVEATYVYVAPIKNMTSSKTKPFSSTYP